MRGPSSALGGCIARHVLQLPCNRQLAIAIDQLGSAGAASDPSFLALLEKWASCIPVTQLVEDMNGVQSNASAQPCR
eukprot:747955-Alexandrium_andersonii.AAC.1